METFIGISNHVSEVELIYKSKIKASERPQIRSSQQAYEIFVNHWDENKLEFIEQFKVLLLSRAQRILGICEISSGGVASTVVDIRLILAAAIRLNACSIIISHNHPSGNLQPSNADKNITHKIKEACKLFDIILSDHLIISCEGYYSFADENEL